MKIVGIDPGLSGAIALYSTIGQNVVAVWDIPTLQVKRGKTFKRQVDLAALEQIFFLELSGCTAFLEDVGGMPGEAAAGAFNFGDCVGVIRAFLHLHRIPCTRISPAAWKKALKVTADKDGARFRASQLMPEAAYHWPLKKHHNRAEAALIAYYSAMQLTYRAVDYAA